MMSPAAIVSPEKVIVILKTWLAVDGTDAVPVAVTLSVVDSPVALEAISTVKYTVPPVAVVFRNMSSVGWPES